MVPHTVSPKLWNSLTRDSKTMFNSVFSPDAGTCCKDLPLFSHRSTTDVQHWVWWESLTLSCSFFPFHPESLRWSWSLGADNFFHTKQVKTVSLWLCVRRYYVETNYWQKHYWKLLHRDWRTVHILLALRYIWYSKGNIWSCPTCASPPAMSSCATLRRLNNSTRQQQNNRHQVFICLSADTLITSRGSSITSSVTHRLCELVGRTSSDVPLCSHWHVHSCGERVCCVWWSPEKLW